MSLIFKVGMLAGAASATLVGVSYGDTTPPSDTDSRIAALESQIAQLKTDTGSNWLTGQRAEEIRALVEDVIADSETRTSLLQNGGTAGWDNGFYLSNGDGSFSLRIGGQSQFRWLYNNKDSADEETSGFELRRVKLWFKGNVINKELTYKIVGAFERDGGLFQLEDAYMTKHLDNGYAVSWGQFKAPFLREELVSSQRQLAVERSYVNEWFSGGRTQGVSLSYTPDDQDVHFWVAYSDGATLSPFLANGGGDNDNTAFAADGNEFAFTARVEGRLAGSWSQFDDFTSWSDDEEFGLLVGGAIHWQDGEYGVVADEVETVAWTGDISAEFAGANLFGSLTGLSTDANMSTTADYDQFGIVVQGGFFVTPDEWEIFGRWEFLDLDGAVASDEVTIVTFGFNKYYSTRHGAKWTTDLVWALDPIPAGSSGLGLAADGVDEEDQITLRTQFQFLF